MIRGNAPDIVGLSEVTPDWSKALEKLLPEYKYSIAEPSYGGIAIFSRFPIKKGIVKHFGLNPRVEAIVSCKTDNTMTQPGSRDDVFVVCFHPNVPMTPAQLELRNRELDEVAQEVASIKMPVLVFGDINCTPFSCYFQKFLNDSRLLDTETGFGIQPTWNALMPAPILPIDHCFSSEDFITQKRCLTSRTGSDHIPVLVEVIRNE